MARRKRRKTKKSRSQSPAARPRLTLGDVVRVKDGVMDPDYDGYCIGGWSGEIIALDTWEQTPMVLIAWDATTQRDRIAPEVRRRATSQGLSVSQMCNWLRVLDTTERSQVDQRVRHQLHRIVSLLDAFKAEQQSLELVFPRKGPLNPHA